MNRKGKQILVLKKWGLSILSGVGGGGGYDTQDIKVMTDYSFSHAVHLQKHVFFNKFN